MHKTQQFFSNAVWNVSTACTETKLTLLTAESKLSEKLYALCLIEPNLQSLALLKHYSAAIVERGTG